MKRKYRQEFTTAYHFTFETATMIANAWSKGRYSSGKDADWLPEYTTTIKIEGIDSDECWALTNRYDPDIRAFKHQQMINEQIEMVNSSSFPKEI